MSVEEAKPRVSVVTASYNYADYIRETIESVINQTYDNWELIIVDDGSRDNSVDVIKEYCKKDSRIKLFTHPNNENLGLKDTLLLGVKEAKGEWIAFLESDDIFKENALEEKVKVADSNPDVKIVFSDVEMFGDEEAVGKLNQYLEKSRCFLCKKGHFEKDDLDFIVNRNFVPTFSCVMAKREKLLELDYETPVKQCLDIFLWAQFAAEDFYYINQKLTKWRMHRESYINSADSNIIANAEFTSKLSYFVYSNKKHTLLNRIKYFFQYLKCCRKKCLSIRLKTGQIVFFNKEYNFKK
jgi:glycosyltransferase involved in cell wall biosynthesis